MKTTKIFLVLLVTGGVMSSLSAARAEMAPESDDGEASPSLSIGNTSLPPESDRYESELETFGKPSSRAPLIRGEAVSVGNSDAFAHREDRLSFTQPVRRGRLTSYGAEVDRINGSADVTNYTGLKGVGTFDFRANQKLSLAGAGGASDIKLSEKNEGPTVPHTMSMWRLRGTYSPVKDTDLRIEGNDDYSYLSYTDDSKNSHAIVMQVQNYSAEVESTTLAGWQLRSTARQSYFEDSNQQIVSDNLILRDVFLSPFVLKLGAAGGWTRFSKTMSTYWSPQTVEAFGAKMVASKEFTSAVELESQVQYGYHREHESVQGDDLSAEVHLRYHAKSGWLASLNESYYDSEHGGYWRNEVGVNVEIPL